MTTPDAYLEGSPLDRAVFLALILAGAFILVRRRVSVAAVLRGNGWLIALYAYCLISVLWSDYPFVAFKRWFKDFGNVVLILVLLTETEPISAVKAALVRCAYVLVPVSFLFVRYYPALGRVYGGWNRDELMYVGVATHKNTLGALLLVSCTVLLWDLIDRHAENQEKKSPLHRFDAAVVLLMACWLLSIANSATALICTFIAAGVLFLTGLKLVRKRMRFAEAYVTAGLVCWLLLDSTFGLSEWVVRSVGRDMTFTTRTSAWSLVLSQEVNPLVGAGFKSFWTGDRMARLWQDLPGIVQAHNGYVETFLNGGILGLLLVVAILLAAFRRIKPQVASGDAYGRARMAFWTVALFYNFSEAAFNQMSLLWFVTVLIVAEVPRPRSARVAASARASPPWDRADAFVARRGGRSVRQHRPTLGNTATSGSVGQRGRL